MDRFLVKSEHVKTEHKKHRVKSYHEDDGAGVLERRALQKSEHNDYPFMVQLAAHLARQSGLVKLSDDGNKATFGKPSGDDVYITSTSAVATCSSRWRSARRALLHQEVSASESNQSTRTM